MKLLASSDFSGNSFIEPVPSDLYEAYVLYINGVNNAGQDLFAQDIGTVRLLLNGRDILNCDYQDLLEYSKLHGGSVREDTNTGATFEHVLVIPRGFQDGNVEQIQDGDRAQFSINFGANVGTKVSSGTIELYGRARKTGTQLYNMKMLAVNDTIGGATTKPIIYREENIIALYPRITSRSSAAAEADITRIRCEADKKEVCNVVREALRYSSYNMRNNDSGQNSKVGEILIANDGDIGEYLTDSVKIDLTTTGAVTFDTLVIAADFDPVKQRITTEQSGEEVAMVLRRKDKEGKTRPVRVVRAALGVKVR